MILKDDCYFQVCRFFTVLLVLQGMVFEGEVTKSCHPI